MKKEHVDLLKILDNDVLYAPSQIADLGLEVGTWSDRPDPSKARNSYRRVLATLANRHFGPREGHVPVKGQSEQPAWTGKTWKTLVDK